MKSVFHKSIGLYCFALLCAGPLLAKDDVVNFPIEDCERKFLLLISDEVQLGLADPFRPMPPKTLSEEDFNNHFIAIQDEVLDFYLKYWELDPEFRPTKELAKRLGVSEQQANAIMLYFNVDDGLTPHRGLGLRTYSRAKQLEIRRENFPLFRYIVDQFTKKSVKEISEELRHGKKNLPHLSETEIYRFMFRIDLSGISLWKRPLKPRSLDRIRNKAREHDVVLPKKLRTKLDIVLHLRNEKGWDNERIGSIVESTPENISDLLHHLGIETTTRTWTSSEEAFLRDYFEVMTPRELADLLQRTEASIGKRAERLGLTTPTFTDREPLVIPPYGKLKADGILIREPLEAYLWDHVNNPVPQMAKELRVSHSTVQNWMEKLGIHIGKKSHSRKFHFSGVPLESSSNRKSRLARYKIQHEIVNEIADWLIAHPGKKISNATKALGIRNEKLFGGASYHPEKSTAFIFPDRDQALFAIKKAVEARGGEYFLYSERFNTPPSDMMREHWREELAQQVAQWLKENPRKTVSAALKSLKKPKADRAYGVGLYGVIRQKKTQRDQRIFDDREQALFAIQAAARKIGAEYYMMDDMFKFAPSDKMRAAWQKEAVEVLSQWFAQNDGTANKAIKELGLSQARLTGATESDTNIFESRSALLLALKEQTKRDGTEVLLLREKLDRTDTEDIRQVWKQEVKELVLEWQRTHPGDSLNQTLIGLKINQGKVYGTANYAEGEKRYASRIFDSQEEARAFIFGSP